MPKISVVIPVFNGEKTIQETIQSVLAQTHTDLELIIINDGSRDRTADLVGNIDDDRLHLFSYENAGLAASRNRGIERSTGEYISFLDADDLWTKDKLELQLQALENNPQAAVAYSWTDFIDEDSNFFRPGCHISVNGKVGEQLLLVNVIENGSNVLVRKAVFDRVGNFDTELSTAADWDMWLRIAKEYEFVAVPTVQVLYRFSPSSMSAQIWYQEAECLQVLHRHFPRFPNCDRQFQRDCLANLYQYLIFRCFECDRRREFGLAAFTFALKMLYYRPEILLYKRLVLSVFLRSTSIALLPQATARSLQPKFERLCSLYDLFAYTKLAP